MVTADYYYADWGCLVDFFPIQGWKIAGMSGRVLNSQPKNFVLSQVPLPFDLSAMATPCDMIRS